MRMRALVAIALLLGGCATLDTADDGVRPGDKPLWFSRPSGAMNVFAMRDLTSPSRQVGELYERGRGEIDPAHSRVFIGSADHGLYALRSTSLDTIWRFETLGAVQSEPLYDPDLDYLYFGSNDGALYCVHAFDGTLVWRFNSGAEIARKPVKDGPHGERLFFTNAADNLFAVERRTGKLLWHQHRTPALGMEIAGYAGPAWDAGLVYQPYSDGTVEAYKDADGGEGWASPVDLAAEAEHEAGGEQQRYLDVDTTPVLDTVELPREGRAPEVTRVLYVASYAGGVFMLEAQSGAIVSRNEKATGVSELAVWQERAHPPNAHGPFHGMAEAPARKYLLASSGTTGIWALDPAAPGMRDVWRDPIPEGGVTALVPVAGALILGTTRYGMFLVSPINGRPMDGFDLGTGFSQAPVVFGHRAYALSNAGTALGIQVELPVDLDRPQAKKQE
jgi:outer membrane protein assembly factor BamB